jgi:L-ribulokinase
VPGSILPGCHGIEAGQSAVGDIFNWFVDRQRPGGEAEGNHESLTERARSLAPGESGLLALDWNNGNRCVLVDQRLTGLLVGQTLHTRPEEIYRALIEATAFGALMIIRRLEEYGVEIKEIINCGGIAEKNALIMQIYADVTGRPMKISRSAQTCALGAAMCGAVAAGKSRGGHADFATATEKMTGVKATIFRPDPKAHEIYSELFSLYRDLHDAFGATGRPSRLDHVMKRLIEIRNAARRIP